MGNNTLELTRSFRPGGQICWRFLRGFCSKILARSRRTPRRLRLAETISLGEHRFVAVVAFEGSRFLLGGTSNSLVLLARLNPMAEKVSGPCLGRDAANTFAENSAEEPF
jgi:flagellar biogenesis protein FliO